MGTLRQHHKTQNFKDMEMALMNKRNFVDEQLKRMIEYSNQLKFKLATKRKDLARIQG